MTTVVCDIRHEVDGVDVPSLGALEWKPTARRGYDGALVLPEPFTVTLDGETSPSVSVRPTPVDASWAWAVVERQMSGSSGKRRIYQVPDSETDVQFVDLVEVNPSTLEPIADYPTVAESIAAEAAAREDADADLEAATATAQMTADGAVTAYESIPDDIANPATEIGGALAGQNATLAGMPSYGVIGRDFSRRLDSYNLRPDNLSKWRAARARAAGGLGTAHITAFLDSIMYGATATGVSQPKPTNAIYGRLKRMFDREYGDAGTGIVVPWDKWYDTPADDPRLVMTGTVTTGAFGPHQKGCIRWLNGSGANYVEFTATCTEFIIYAIQGGSRPRVTIDGGSESLIAGNPNTDPGLTAYDPEPGYWGQGASAGQIVTRVPAGSLGEHTIRIYAPTNNTSYMNLIGIEGSTGAPGVRISGMARSGSKMLDFVTDDQTNGLSGMAASLDMAQADLAIMLVGMNDYQVHTSLATFKSYVTMAIQRQRATSTYAANGDVLLVACAQPDYDNPIPLDGILTPPLTDYIAALYEVADEQDAPLLDLASRWVDFDTSDALGYFADPLHPNDLGSEDIARAIYNVLTSV